jgi:hypothetical protein
MKKLYFISENCNSWNSRNFEDIFNIESECHSCSSYGSFSLVDKYTVWRWEIDIPHGWEYGQWERVRLYPVEVEIYIVQCEICGEVYRVYPSFIIKGTTLTFSALIFVAFIYEKSDLVWRDIPEKFCDEYNQIAHSTLYKAVHGLGKSITDNENKIRDGIRDFFNRYLSLPEKESEVSVWPSEKSLHEHTLRREAALRELLLPLAAFFKFMDYSFFRLFYTYIRPVRTILSGVDPPVGRLYKKSETQIKCRN